MDITKGNLDDISRPASSERSRPGSRVSNLVLSEGVRMSQDRIGALEVLSSELTETQVWQTIEENNLDCPSENLTSDQDVAEEENKDPELQKAIMKMKRLDKILATKMSTEKEVKKQGRELHQKLWKELKDHKMVRSSECTTDEAENTRLFLALTSNTSKDCSEEVDYVPVFGTQVPEQENDLSCKPGTKVSGSEVIGKSSNSVEVGPEVKEVKLTESRQHVTDKNKHRQDFIKRNIELASSAGSLGPLTQEEKKRLEELLKDIDEEETYVDPTAKTETDFTLCAVSTTPDEGYRPQAAELEQLLHIDGKLQLLLPVEEFLSVRGPYGYHSFSQVKKAGELGERVLRDMKESREQEECLCEIQQQLQLLTKRQHPDSLTEEQIKSLLMECEMAWSRSSDSGTQGFSDPKLYCSVDGQIMSLLASTPRLSSSALSELLQEAAGTPTSLV
ncbi:fibrous sheath-interacting protein 1 isoform X1 [Hemibagrus wyckioides]|uniref:fibrous sheath-interacting protein 1 isoform X1 n=1 Tax=Hemibagrus wyckioides TaxID=337641 RepID=UPI00266B8C9F|nr:fibrous sheath-interacting protein 1 isoform X1 [Hemibagrus wyckioides]XP_058254423.1 fibrous sheath-interacting protein 1 isoform X1 [Hemibagrus wyckioides]